MDTDTDDQYNKEYMKDKLKDFLDKEHKYIQEIDILKYENSQLQIMTERKAEEYTDTEKSFRFFSTGLIKNGLTRLKLEDFINGPKALANALHLIILKKSYYRYNSAGRCFEYFNCEEEWKEDDEVKQLSSNLFSLLYQKCKELYDNEIIRLEKQCFSGDNDSGELFADKRDNMRIQLTIIMGISNGEDKYSIKTYLTAFLSQLAGLIKFSKKSKQ